jgi:iron complex transport system substrate-binding protein
MAESLRFYRWLAWGRVALMVAFIAPALAVNAVPEVHITDDRGVEISLSHSPQRIVSLLPSLTETVCALGQCQRLVGVDRFSNFPASVRALPQVGDGITPALESIIALKPDVVLLATSSRVIGRLQSMGIPVVALEPKTHADVQRVLALLGQLLAVPAEAGSTRVWGDMVSTLNTAAQSLPASVKNKRVYFEVNNGPYAASESSFIGETLMRLGVKNIVSGHLGAFPKLNPEFVVRADPDFILVGEGDAHELRQRPGWASLRAVREKRLCTFSPAQSDMLVRPGPRMAEAARIMAQCLEDKSR